MEYQANIWDICWGVSSGKSDTETVATSFAHLTEEVYQNHTVMEIDQNKLDKALRGYSKNFLGADSWHKDELKLLPPVAKGHVCDAINTAH